MCIAAAYELAKYAEDRGLDENNIIPALNGCEVYVREAVAVGMKTNQQGAARMRLSREGEKKFKVVAHIFCSIIIWRWSKGII